MCYNVDLDSVDIGRVDLSKYETKNIPWKVCTNHCSHSFLFLVASQPIKVVRVHIPWNNYFILNFLWFSCYWKVLRSCVLVSDIYQNVFPLQPLVDQLSSRDGWRSKKTIDQTQNSLYKNGNLKQIVVSINQFNLKCDWLLIAPCSITLESSVNIMRIQEMITSLKSSWIMSNKFSLLLSHECREISAENMNTDVRV